MALFAKLDENNNVLDVIVVNDDILLDSNGTSREELGISFLVQWSNGHPFWKQTHVDGDFRKNYAAPGYKYSSDMDAFIPPRPFESWVLDEATCLWNAPVSIPQDGRAYAWNEETTSWIPLK
jgi:hypothetical protein